MKHTNNFESEIRLCHERISSLSEQKRKLGLSILEEQNIITKLTGQLKCQKGKIEITDPAIVRYMERVCGLDIGQVRQDILPPNAFKLIQAFAQNGKYPASDKHRVVVQDATIVTIIDSGNLEVETLPI